MSKKIKTLVQKYEKDMQFENRFDELKHKLDLIPDPETKSEVITIKRKLMPAYSMMMVLLMLVTGLIGLQFGLNTNYLTGPERVDIVEEQLMELTDIYEREAIETVIIDSLTKINVYVGIKNNNYVLIFFARTAYQSTLVSVEINSNTAVLDNAMFMNYLLVDSLDSVTIIFNVSHQNSESSNLTITRDYSKFFELFG